MSFIQRVATIAAMTFSLVGLATSSPGIAGEVAANADPAPALTAPVLIAAMANTATAVLVPPPVLIPLPDAAIAPARFASLGDAVAAQQGSGADEHLRCLAGAVYFESKGEPLPGQLAVAQVILNRVRSGRFADDVCGVVKQRGQFSFVRAGSIPPIDESGTAYRTAVAVARVALAQAWEAPAPAALFFHTAREGSGARMTRVATIGNHVFYR